MKKNLTNFWCLSIPLMLSGCNHVENQLTISESDVLIENPRINQDTTLTINYPEPASYVTSDSNYLIDILQTSQYHDDEIEDGFDEQLPHEPWYGLFIGPETYHIDKAVIKTTRVNDPIMDDDESEKTGWLIETTNPDPALLLMNNAEFTTSPIDFVKPEVSELYPGDSLQFTFLKNTYTLFATGTKIRDSYGSEFYSCENYKLFLQTKRDGKLITELLVAHENFDDAMVYILFAGDIDRDGKLDLLLDNARHYNVGNPTLYLSSGADADHLLQILGWHWSTGC